MIQALLQAIQAGLLWVVKMLFGPADLFDSPSYLWLLLLIPVYLLWYVWWYSPRRLIVPFSYDIEKMAKRSMDLSFLRFVPMLLTIAAYFFGVLALARPQAAPETTEKYSEGIDIMLVMDTSGSMETEDFKPNRLEVAKSTAVEFLAGRVDDRIGIVVFAEDAFSFAPLTLDYDLLRKQILDINSNIMPNRGTAVGSAIAVAINRMEESKSPSKVMILLTDGASNRGQIDPITAAKLAADAKIKIYSIGIGKKEFQQQTLYGVQTVQSDLDEGTLQEVAKLTRGKFFRSEDPESLSQIFGEISRMEKTDIVTETYKEITDLYPRLLVVSLILITLAFVLMATFIYNPLEG